METSGFVHFDTSNSAPTIGGAFEGTSTAPFEFTPVPKSVCPNCGYCPHCGRAAQPFYPAYPFYPQPLPWWQQPTITWIAPFTIMSGGNA